MRQSDILSTITSIDGSGIRYHTYSDIGRYTVFPAQYRNRLFPTRVYGRIEEMETKFNDTLGIMCREQGLRITNDLARLTLPADRKVNYDSIARDMTSSEVKRDLLSDEHSYTALVQDITLALHDYIHKSERKNELRKFFLPPGVFDGVINVLTQELSKKPMRPHLCDTGARQALIA